MIMNQIIRLSIAATLTLAAFAIMPIPAAHAENEVLESDLESFPVGTKIDDETRIVMPDNSKVRVLILSTGTTKTLQGPYEGTIPNYKEERTWWERITGRGKQTDAPIGATRGLVRPPDANSQ
jgi:hypothetical protein